MNMNKVEKALGQQLSKEEGVPYPDFDAMWQRIEHRDDEKDLKSVPDKYRVRPKSWRKIALITTAAAVLTVTPVFAAIQMNWGGLMNGRSGIEAALQQGLGQTINQSVTHDGITLTLHTAVVDDNRTVIIYTLDLGEHENSLWSFDHFELRDEQGKVIEGSYTNYRWDEAHKRYSGLFESEWTPQQDQVKVQLAASQLHLLATMEQELPYDASSHEVQRFEIGEAGMQQLELQSFDEGSDQIMLYSVITFSDPEMKKVAYPSITLYREGKEINVSSYGTFGTPGDNGEYTIQQFYKKSDVLDPNARFRLSYINQQAGVDGSWDFDLELNKQEMLAGTLHKKLDRPLLPDVEGIMADQLIITPTQIRLIVTHEKRYYRMPYMNFELNVDGHVLEGGRWNDPEDGPHQSTYRFEVPVDLPMITDITPITLRQSYKVTAGETDQSFKLTNISDQKQVLETEVDGYPIKWTYYKKDNDLYVESKSSDPLFGGVNQTYVYDGKKKHYGRPISANFMGDGNNRAVDVYRDYEKTDAEIYIWFYTTDEPEASVEVSLQP